VAVVGAGIAGTVCARALADAGIDVQVFDKSRGAGGRMATRRAEWVGADGASNPARFDHGAPAFEARTERFQRFVEAAARDGRVAPWHPLVEREGRLGPAGAAQWVPTPDMPTLCRWLLADIRLRTGCTVDLLRRAPEGWVVQAGENRVADGLTDVVVAVPPPQAAPLLAPHRPDWAGRTRSVAMLPCWTLMAVTDDPAPVPAWSIAEFADGPIGRIVRTDARPGRVRVPGHAHWVVHASAAWSRAHLEDAPADVQSGLQAALERALERSVVWCHASVHRWRYAVAPADAAVPALCDWDPDTGLGVCGDALGGAGAQGIEGLQGVERAWRSGRALAARIVERHRAVARA
jgi:predicted NAD/FAD-dependent oxidoreductase